MAMRVLVSTDGALDKASTLLGASVESRLAEGDPREMIIAAANDWAADLIVMSARGLSAVKEFLLGSVSLGVARHAPCPVLVCKGAPHAVQTVTIAHDGSPGAREALRFVGAWPWPASTHARVIGAGPPHDGMLLEVVGAGA